MGGVEVGLEEEGVVAFGGVHGDVDGGDAGLFEVADEFCLFLGVEAEVGVDGEDEEFVPGGFAAGEEFSVRFGFAFDDGTVTRPHIDDAEVGVGVEAFGEFFSLVKHVTLEGVANLEPGEHFFFLDKIASSTALEGVEVDEGLVGNHASEGEADAGIFAVVVVTAFEVTVVFDGENLLEENEAVENGGFESARDGDDVLDALGMAGGQSEGKQTAD